MILQPGEYTIFSPNRLYVVVQCLEDNNTGIDKKKQRFSQSGKFRKMLAWSGRIRETRALVDGASLTKRNGKDRAER
jgi:hypothetical protein